MTFMACTAMLASAVALNSCKSNDPVSGLQSDTEAVKTEFSIAIPAKAAGNGARKMPAETAQTDGTFQGMADSIFLVPFAAMDTVESTDARLGKNIYLRGGIAKTGELGTNSHAKVFTDVSIPLNTGSFLLYAKSAKTGSKFAVGSLKPAADTSANTPAGFTFELEQIQPSPASLFNDGTTADNLLDYLTSVAGASDGLGTPKKWYEYPADSAAMHAMFVEYIRMHGLSSFEVERVLSDLYRSLKTMSTPIATSIKAAINNATYATIENDSVKLVSTLKNFPQSVLLPQGSVDIKWNGSTHVFEQGAYSNMAALDNYVYPAQLWYRVNSKIKTSNTSKQTMYDNTNDWDAILAGHTGAAAVNSTTRAVAIVHPIQYAVARLDVGVKLKAEELEDNSKAAIDTTINVNCAAGFPVTAVLVGGQKSVGFEFKPKGAIEYTIYDSVMANPITATTAAIAAYNHTLVLENGNEDVMIAIEMENKSGVDFYGHDNMLIPRNGKFYVCAKLESKAASATGITVNTPNQVFKQDYITTANLTLKDLKGAYNSLPDLRTPQLELGFSVDLTWQTGNIYDIEF